MTFHRRMLLVGSDHQFAQLVQTHIHKTFLVHAPHVRFDDLPKVVRRDTDGALLLLASDPHDADRIETAVRELRLQQLPPRLAVLANERFPAGKRLEALSTFLEANLAWPGHTRELNTWVRRAVVPGPAFPDPVQETTADRIRSRLLTLTPSLASLTEQLEIAATHDVTVLIEGETGTGKTHLAKLIHDCSP
nr:sigma 54-interacting transcriptional regulator [Fimbriiglobus sp.]